MKDLEQVQIVTNDPVIRVYLESMIENEAFDLKFSDGKEHTEEEYALLLEVSKQINQAIKQIRRFE